MPKVELKETTGCTKKLRVEVEQERLDQEIKNKLKDVKREFQLPGFRKGKAPENLLLRRFGSTIRQDAIMDMIPKIIGEVFESEGYKSVNEPAIGDLEISESGPVAFTVSFKEIPDIDVSGFEGLRINRMVLEVTDDNIDNEIERIRHMYAKQVEVERGAQAGDILVVNLQKLTSSGLPIIGDKLEKHVIVLDGQSTPSPDFDEKILGMKKGERKTVQFTYDESINHPELVGTTDSYDVEVLQVLENIVPELDDKFIASLGEFRDIDDLRNKTSERLKVQYKLFSERRLHTDLINEFIKQNPFEVPNAMVKKVIQSEIDRMKSTNPGETFDENNYSAQIRPDAVRAVQTFILLDKIKDNQNIEVAKEEINERIEALAAINGMEARDYRRKLIKEGELEEYKNNIANNKAYDWMVKVADISDEIIQEKQHDSHIIKP